MTQALLLGAGFSYDLGMPVARELTEVFLTLFDKRKLNRVAYYLSKAEPFGDDRPINIKAIEESFNLLLRYKESGKGNYEELLAQLQDLNDDPKKTRSDKDSYHFIFGFLYDVIYAILCAFQAEAYRVLYPKNLQWFSKLENLLSQKETWVFSLNHDILFECLAADLGIAVSYGDVETISFPVSNLEMMKTISFSCNKRDSYRFDSPGFFKNTKGVNLVKLHGSLSELEYDDGKIVCNLPMQRKNSFELMMDFQRGESMAYYHQHKKVPSGRDRIVTNSAGELDIMRKAMLTGGKKYSKTANAKHGEEKLQVFDAALREISQLTIIGYGFGDKHINFRIAHAMARKDDLKVRFIDPANNKIPEFLEPFDYESRVRSAFCGAAHWMDYCKSEKWDPKQMESLKENSKYRVEIRTSVERALKATMFNF